MTVFFWSKGEEKHKETTTEPVFDYLSILYQPYVEGQLLSGEFAVTNGSDLKQHTYEVAGKETLETGIGQIETVVIVRYSSRGARKIWFSPAHDYLPVRLYVDDKGTSLIRLSAISR